MSQQANTPSGEAMPPVPAPRGRLASRLVRWCRGAAVRVSLLISPWPAALLMRKVFAASGARLATALDKHAPTNVIGLINQRYGADPDMLLDVFRPASASGPLPLMVWVHGGGFVGGTKDQLAGYFKLVASNGFVVDPRYGDNNDLARLVDQTRAHGIRLLLDLVPGHTSGTHPWFVASANDPRDHRYIWAAPAGGQPGRRAAAPFPAPTHGMSFRVLSNVRKMSCRIVPGWVSPGHRLPRCGGSRRGRSPAAWPGLPAQRWPP